jgi:hypothetical protein
VLEGVEDQIIQFIFVSFVGAVSSLIFFYFCALILNYRNKRMREIQEQELFLNFSKNNPILKFEAKSNLVELQNQETCPICTEDFLQN